jgi:bifunctional DNA-binding transcriptional regulator/antitoxin component of YhaV-PrlF toxin-antitoxin module
MILNKGFSYESGSHSEQEKSECQIAIPKSGRQKLAIGQRDQLNLEVEKDSLILKPRLKSYSQHLRGLNRSVWERNI